MTRNLILQIFKKEWFEKATIVMGILGQFCPYVQAYKIFSLKSSYAISLSSQLLALTSMICWLLYGYTRGIRPITWSNIVGVIGISLVILGIWLY